MVEPPAGPGLTDVEPDPVPPELLEEELVELLPPPLLLVLELDVLELAEEVELVEPPGAPAPGATPVVGELRGTNPISPPPPPPPPAFTACPPPLPQPAAKDAHTHKDINCTESLTKRVLTELLVGSFVDPLSCDS